MDVLKVGVKQTQLFKSHEQDFFCAIQLSVIWEYSRNTYGFTMALLKKDEIPPQLPWISVVTEAILVGVMTIPLG